jgi:hypothetical protein
VLAPDLNRICAAAPSSVQNITSVTERRQCRSVVSDKQFIEYLRIC